MIAENSWEVVEIRCLVVCSRCLPVCRGSVFVILGGIGGDSSMNSWIFVRFRCVNNGFLHVLGDSYRGLVSGLHILHRVVWSWVSVGFV